MPEVCFCGPLAWSTESMAFPWLDQSLHDRRTAQKGGCVRPFDRRAVWAPSISGGRGLATSGPSSGQGAACVLVSQRPRLRSGRSFHGKAGLGPLNRPTRRLRAKGRHYVAGLCPKRCRRPASPESGTDRHRSVSLHWRMIRWRFVLNDPVSRALSVMPVPPGLSLDWHRKRSVHDHAAPDRRSLPATTKDLFKCPDRQHPDPAYRAASLISVRHAAHRGET
ncbi:hypothetical protein PANO111632_02110 [Paracoccus nototheniae]